ncbi:putative ATPase/DNA-binding XRE family transcriptional regulator/putative transcriptional regulator [Spirilliplanes yamanashiensis]|nr:putative ATPase/DNA-binding XRE family transcriptional regulator/putative transcriptional regulator [Spirilliplanes yamanashiensis]
MMAEHGAGRGPGFGAVLRARRRGSGLTQAELAERAGIGVRTVRDLERGHASRPQRTTVELLATALNLAGAARAEFLAAARGQAPEVSGPPPVAPLPPVPGLVGRDADVAELTARLTAGDRAGGGGPLQGVTLVGLAGVGKTSLALTVAHALAERHPGGVPGVVVSDVSTAADVLTTIAAVYRVGRPDDLVARLAGTPGLVLVDAVERAPDAVAEALQWLAAKVPTVRFLATGRHPIGVPGEQVWPVAPLEVPPPDLVAAGPEPDLMPVSGAGSSMLPLPALSPDPEPAAETAEAAPPDPPAAVAAYPAAALFLDRLARVRREPLSAAEVPALVTLLRRLGGLPLALELAAARGRVLTVTEILDRYGDRVLDLTGLSAGPGVGATAPDAAVTLAGAAGVEAVSLRDAVAASYRLLEPDERRGLRLLAVFRNRWSVELAEQMLTGGGCPADPVALLDRLLELGLLGVRGSGAFRFRLLDVVRDFGVERAAARGERAGISRLHAEVLARFAERIAPDLAGSRPADAMAQLDDVNADVGAALAHAAGDDPVTALRLAAALPRWWRFRGRDRLGRQWLRRLLDDPRTAGAAPELRAWAQVGLAQLALEHGAAADEIGSARAALDAFTRLDDVPGQFAARTLLAGLCTAVGGYDEARGHAEEVLALAGRTGRIRDMAVAQNNLAWHELRAGDVPAARQRLTAVDRLAAQAGEHRLRAVALANLADVARLDGSLAEAETMARRAVSTLDDLGAPAHRRRALATAGLALAEAGRVVEATEVLADLRRTSAELDGPAAMVEGAVAEVRGQRERARRSYGTAARWFEHGSDPRDTAEALACLAGVTAGEVRQVVLECLGKVCRANGIVLLPRQRTRAALADGEQLPTRDTA